MSTDLNILNVGDALIVQFARPELRNPLSISILDEIREIVAVVGDDSRIKKLIFTGVDDVFASGADLREIGELESDDARKFALRGQTLMSAIASLPQVTIAAVNGYCFGGALDLSLACDRRTASPKAIFSHPGAGLGIITGWGGTQRLPRLIGEANTLEMFFTGTRIAADEALRIGLVDQIADDALEASLNFGPNLIA